MGPVLFFNCIKTDPFTWSMLQERLIRVETPGSLSDVYDGEEYKRHANFLSEPSNVSLTLNTDGVAIYRSSKVELWPVWFTVNELPKCKRYNNVIVHHKYPHAFVRVV